MTRAVPEYINESSLEFLVASAQTRVVLALPGLTKGLGPALLQASQRLPGRVLAVVDPNERVYRVGYGLIEELEEVFGKGFPLLARPGLRIGCGLIDEAAFFLTMPPQLVEAPADPEMVPRNAVFVEPQVVLAYLREIANGPALDAVLAIQPELATEAQEETLVRIENSQAAKEAQPAAVPLSREQLKATQVSLQLAPPLDFQVHRQSMVYSSLLLYVVIELTACRLDNREIVVRKALLPLLGEKAGIVGRRSFQLNSSGDLSGLAEIQRRTEHLREKIARGLGKPYGAVLLRQDMNIFEAERQAIEALIKAKHPEAIKAFEQGLAPQIKDICQICLEQCLHTMKDEDIFKALRPRSKDRKELAKWQKWKDSDPKKQELAERLGAHIEEALWNNVRQRMTQLKKPQLEVTFREFTLQQMTEEDFTERLLETFHDKKDLAPFLMDRAVIGKATRSCKSEDLDLLDELPFS